MGLLSTLKMEDENSDEKTTELAPKFEPDPEPGQSPSSRRRPAARRKALPAGGTMSTAAVKKMSRDVAGQLAGLIDMTGTLWELSGDKCCAPIVQEQAKPVGDALAACLERNPALLARMVDVDFVTMIIQIGAVGKALKPIGEAVWHNHISGEHHGGGDDGPGFDADAFPPYAVPA